MARKEKKVVVPDFPGTENRDKDKVFQLTEWSAARAENWLFRMMLVEESDDAGDTFIIIHPASLAPCAATSHPILAVNLPGFWDLWSSFNERPRRPNSGEPIQ